MVEKRKNIYLIGMMGTGKSSAGKLVASQLHMDFIDSDNSIEEITQKSVSEIFSCYGEKRFRKWRQNLFNTGTHRKIALSHAEEVCA